MKKVKNKILKKILNSKTLNKKIKYWHYKIAMEIIHYKNNHHLKKNYNKILINKIILKKIN